MPTTAPVKVNPDLFMKPLMDRVWLIVAIFAIITLGALLLHFLRGRAR